jgi:hypothetical protein
LLESTFSEVESDLLSASDESLPAIVLLIISELSLTSSCVSSFEIRLLLEFDLLLFVSGELLSSSKVDLESDLTSVSNEFLSEALLLVVSESSSGCGCGSFSGMLLLSVFGSEL